MWNSFKLKEGTLRLDAREKFSTVRCLNRFPREAADAQSLEVVKVSLDESLSNLSSGTYPYP